MRISGWSSDVCSSDLAVTEMKSLPKKTPCTSPREKSASASGETSASSGVAKSRVPDSMTWRPGRNLSVAGLGVISVSMSMRSEEHTSELQSLMRISYAVFCLKKKTKKNHNDVVNQTTSLKPTT